MRTPHLPGGAERLLRYAIGGLVVAGGLFAIFGTLRVGSVLAVSVGLIACALPIFVFVALRWPAFYCWTFGVVLGFAPFATLPGTGTQLVFFLAVSVALVAALNARAHEKPGRTSRIALWMLLTIAACFMAFLASFGAEAANDFVRWLLASILTLIGIWMAPALRVALARAFVVGAAGGAILSVVLEFVDHTGSFVAGLGLVGYGGAGSVDVRTVNVSGEVAVRATGLYVDPNSAGLFLFMALAVAPFVFTGARRVVLMALITAGAVATLSRSAILTLVVAALIVLVTQRQTAIRRAVIATAGLVGIITLSFVPSIAGRLTTSFSDTDVGASARWDAFGRYPGQLEGHWLFGRGWGLREFTDAFYAYSLNHVANTPLLVVYRSGLVAGIAFLGLLIVGIVISVRGLRSADTGFGMMGAGFIALVLVAFQLDFPVVTMPPLAMAFSILLMNLGAAERLLPPRDRRRGAIRRVTTVRELRRPEPARR